MHATHCTRPVIRCMCPLRNSNPIIIGFYFHACSFSVSADVSLSNSASHHFLQCLFSHATYAIFGCVFTLLQPRSSLHLACNQRDILLVVFFSSSIKIISPYACDIITAQTPASPMCWNKGGIFTKSQRHALMVIRGRNILGRGWVHTDNVMPCSRNME
jgi:hypothetical protein